MSPYTTQIALYCISIFSSNSLVTNHFIHLLLLIDSKLAFCNQKPSRNCLWSEKRELQGWSCGWTCLSWFVGCPTESSVWCTSLGARDMCPPQWSLYHSWWPKLLSVGIPSFTSQWTLRWAFFGCKKKVSLKSFQAQGKTPSIFSCCSFAQPFWKMSWNAKALSWSAARGWQTFTILPEMKTLPWRALAQMAQEGTPNPPFLCKPLQWILDQSSREVTLALLTSTRLGKKSQSKGHLALNLWWKKTRPNFCTHWVIQFSLTN